MVSLAADLGMGVRLSLLTDASAARGIINRSGLGKVKHIEVQEPWLQQVVSQGRACLAKTPRVHNLADLFAKHWSAANSDLFDELGGHSL